MKYAITGKARIYPGLAGWHFIYVGKKESEAIKMRHDKKRTGFGYVPVSVTLGKSTWKTTLFPSKKEGVYLLAIKAGIRKQEGVDEGDTITVRCRVL